MLLSTVQKLNSVVRPFTIIVEGNIGSGKTSFLNRFLDIRDNIMTIAEPVTKWQDMRGHNLLQLMYEDPKKWGFVFQTYVQLTMLQAHLAGGKGQSVKLIERSLHSARFCFIEQLCRSGLMEAEQKAVLDEWYHWLRKQKMLDVDLVVYLRSSPEVVFERVKARRRNEEKEVSLEMLKSLHNLHEDWLIKNAFYVPAPVLVLDANQSLEGMKDEYERCNQRIQEMRIGS